MNLMIFRVGLISFFADLSSELLYPITPLFITAVLGGSMTSVGVIEGIAELTSSLLKGWVGEKSDAIGKRRVFIWSGYLTSTLSRAVIGFSTSWTGVLFGRILDRVGKGVRTSPRDAFLSESVEKEKLGLAFGVHRAMDTFGAVLGPLFALYLLKFWQGEGLRKFYFLSVIPGIFAVLISLSLRDPLKIKVSKKEKVPFRSLPKSYFTFLIGWTVFSVCNSSDAFMILRTQNLGFSLPSTILFYVYFNLVYAISSPFIGRLSDRIPKRFILMASLFIFSMVYAGFGLGVNPLIVFTLYGLFMGASEGIAKALVAECVSGEEHAHMKATAQGYFGMITGIAVLVGSVASGLIWDHFGAAMPFMLSTVGSLVALIVFLILG